MLPRPGRPLILSSQPLCRLPPIDGGSLTDLGALAEPIRIEDGYFTSPDQPGHGIIFDRATVAAHVVDG